MFCETEIVVDARRFSTYPVLTDPRALHRLVMSGFPDVEDAAPRRALGVLFRVDTPAPGRAIVTVRSSGIPRWPELPAGFAAGESREQHLLFSGQQRLSLSCDVNPTRRLPSPRERVRGQRYGLSTPSDISSWFAHKGELHGFSVERVDVLPLGLVRGSGGLALAMARIHAEVLVVDADLFGQAWRSGIGTARAFGCGMLVKHQGVDTSKTQDLTGVI